MISSNEHTCESIVNTNILCRETGELEDPIFARETPPPPAPPKVNTESVQDFPSLGGAVPSAVLPASSNGTGPPNSSIAQRLALKSGLNVSTSSSAPGKPNWNAKVSGASKMDEEFPALGGPSNSRPKPSSTYTSSASTIPSRPNAHHAHAQQQSQSFMNITTVKQAPVKQQKPINRLNARHNGFVQEDFPSLGNPSTGANGGVWSGSGSGVKMKPIPRVKKVAAAPNLRKVEVSDDLHFVPLSASRDRKDSLSEKFDIKEGDGPDTSTTNKDKTKKKKKNRDDNSNSMQLNAAAIFTGGSVGHVDGGIRNTEDDFPSLQSIRNSLPTGRRYQ